LPDDPFEKKVLGNKILPVHPKECIIPFSPSGCFHPEQFGKASQILQGLVV
jgi:hypothetical protein